MAEYDAATKKFFEDLGNTVSPKLPDIPDTESAFRNTVGAIKAVGEKKPSSVGSFIMRSGLLALSKDKPEGPKLAQEGQTGAETITVVEITNALKDLSEVYSDEWIDWEFETLAQTIKKDFGLDLSENGLDVLGALQTALRTNQAHEHWHIFEKIGHALNGNIVDFTILQPLDPHEVSRTFYLLNGLRKEEFSPEIYAYAAATAKNAGVVYLPEEFFGSDAQVFLDELNNDIPLKERVQSLWGTSGKGQTEEEKIQLGKLQEIKEYTTLGEGL